MFSVDAGREPIILGGNDDIKNPEHITQNYRLSKYDVYEKYNRTAILRNKIT